MLLLALSTITFQLLKTTHFHDVFHGIMCQLRYFSELLRWPLRNQAFPKSNDIQGHKMEKIQRIYQINSVNQNDTFVKLLEKASFCFKTVRHIKNSSIWTRASGGSRISRWGVGGANLRCGHFSAKTCVKTKELDPVGGGGHAPVAPPGSANASSSVTLVHN